MNEKRRSLADLRHKDLLEDIARNEHPLLFYFICHLGNRTKYKISTPPFDAELNCRTLAKYNITKYFPPKETKGRKGHSVNCDLDKPVGVNVYKELEEKEICKELCNFFKRLDEEGKHISPKKEDFEKWFWENFKFEEDNERIIENKRIEIMNKYHINIPEPNYKLKRKGNEMIINYEVVDDKLNVIIKIKCSCTKIIEGYKKEEENAYKNYFGINMECSQCERKFFISWDYYYLKIIE